ncbi:unnamed protein product [Notodromas monacha]|uniref:EF-hand domain-containing protein n=1 Tax=Notodromas monacha TaxID=399045 RepID=A0A7R9BIZ1_9CRUS|nr:unnamed protein product [Notodromas monacha]CAG0915572.1 unnamed protein product [Notodromas monacha]
MGSKFRLRIFVSLRLPLFQGSHLFSDSQFCIVWCCVFHSETFSMFIRPRLISSLSFPSINHALRSKNVGRISSAEHCRSMFHKPTFDLSRSFSIGLSAKSKGWERKDLEKRSADESDSDSDSDDEKLKGESAFWRQKMRTHHHAIDINKDGTVSWDDFEELVKRFETLGNMNKDQAESFRKVLQNYWEEFWTSDPNAFVMADEFLRSMHHVVNTSDLRKKVGAPLPYFFKAVDHDGSGEISVEEYKLFFKCLGLPEESAVKSFRAIDKNKDGLLSEKEFVKIGRDFFLSEDESRASKLFWGPLVN